MHSEEAYRFNMLGRRRNLTQVAFFSQKCEGADPIKRLLDRQSLFGNGAMFAHEVQELPQGDSANAIDD